MNLKYTIQVDTKTGEVNIKRLAKSVKQFESEVENVSRHSVSAVKRLDDGFLSLKNQIVGAAAAWGAFELGNSFIKTASEAERVRIMLDGVTGSAEAAKDSFNWLLNFESPVGLDAVQDAFIKLETVDLSDVKNKVESLVNAVSFFGGSDENLKRAAVAIQQMASKGVVSMEELRQQLAEAIPSATKIMARELNMTIAELSDKISEGAVTADKGLDALFRGLEKDFKGASDRMMNSWTGFILKSQKEWQKWQIEVMDSGVFDALKAELNSVLDHIRHLRENGKLEEWARSTCDSITLVVNSVSKLTSTVYPFLDDIAEFYIVSKVTGLLLGASAAVTTYADALSVATTRQHLLNTAVKSFLPVLAAYGGYKIGGMLSEWWNGTSKINQETEVLTQNLKKQQAILRDTELSLAGKKDNTAAKVYVDEWVAEYERQVREFTAKQEEIKLKEAETLKQKKDLLKQWDEIQESSLKKDTEGVLYHLALQYDAFKAVVKDQIELEKWYLAEKTKIETQAAREHILLLEELYEYTGLVEYAEQAIEAQNKIFDAEQEKWSKILSSDEDAYILREKKERDYADYIFNSINGIIDAEYNAADERRRIHDNLIDDFIRDENELNQRQRQRQSQQTIFNQSYDQPIWERMDALSPIYEYNGLIFDDMASLNGYVENLQNELDERARQEAETANEIARAEQERIRATEQLTSEYERQVAEQQRIFDSSYNNYHSFIEQVVRRDWGLSDWNVEYDRLADILVNGNPDEADYFETSIDTLNDIVDVLRQIDSIERQAANDQRSIVNTLTSVFGSIDQMIDRMSYGNLAPVLSFDIVSGHYQELFSQAQSLSSDPEKEKEFAEAVNSFTAFIPDYLNFMSAYSGQYNSSIEQAKQDLTTLKKDASFSSMIFDFKDLFSSLNLGDSIDEIRQSFEDLFKIDGELKTLDINLDDFYNVYGKLKTQKVDLFEFYKTYNFLKTQYVDLGEFYYIYNILKTQDVDLNKFYETYNFLGSEYVNLGEFYKPYNSFQTQDVDLEKFYNIYNILKTQDVDLSKFYETYDILKTQHVDLSKFYETYNFLTTMRVDLDKFYKTDNALDSYMVDLSQFYGTANALGSYMVDLSKFYGINNELDSYIVDLSKFYETNNKLDSYMVDLSKFYGINNELDSYIVDLSKFYEISGELSKYDIDISDLISIKGMIDAGDIEGATQALGELNAKISAIRPASNDTIGTTSSDGVAGLAGALENTHPAFDSAINDLGDLARNTKTKMAEVENFFNILATRMGISYGAGVSDAVISNLTKTEYTSPKYSYVQVNWTPGEPYKIIVNGRQQMMQDWTVSNPSNPGDFKITTLPYAANTPEPATFRVPNYGKGGVAKGLYRYNEIGNELIIPTYQPQAANYFKAVGANPEIIAEAVAKKMNDYIENLTDNKDINITVKLDGHVIANAIANRVYTNSNLRRALQRV